ncbi:hypothetical protein RhiirA4_451341 [Rhizophagus irregularis]|uniref:DUF659 domain-containing protein n=1 Tax=Rhizophagus irregularis TaxID=588596 RepID=A0A2I1FVE7_9GLOM|nr:hypothetical protein RhiirA4_451341 [Rhizophagus irregularis]
MYLPQIFENHLTQLKLMFESKPVAITMDETTDDCARSVVNTSFCGFFNSNSAAYMKKCFREVLKPVMPQLIHAPCCAHILNLIDEHGKNLIHLPF